MTSRIVAIDPGGAAKGNAWAGFVDGELVTTGQELHWVPGACLCLFVEEQDPLIVIECPEDQGARTRNASPLSLMDLCWNGAGFAGALLMLGGLHARLETVTPTTWKGQLPKPIPHAHVWQILTPSEKRAVATGRRPEPGLSPAIIGERIEQACEKGALKRWRGQEYYPKNWPYGDILDAVGIGLVQLGRLSLVR